MPTRAHDRGPVWLALLLAVVTMAGCAAGTGPRGADAAGTPLATVTGDPAFELAGRIALRQGDRALSAALRWRYDGVVEEMLLTGPLGAGSAEIVRDADGVSFRSGRVERRAVNVQALMLDTLGFALPLDGLRYWARGQPGPGSTTSVVERDARGRLVAVVQAGWRVLIAAHAEAPLEALPRRVHVDSEFAVPGTEPGAAAEPLQVRLLIDEWVQAPPLPALPVPR
jgi:outer membrane lipoprotein LolB